MDLGTEKRRVTEKLGELGDTVPILNQGCPRY
jgi:hypothetical protein